MKTLIAFILLLSILFYMLSGNKPSIADEKDIPQESSSASITITMTTIDL